MSLLRSFRIPIAIAVILSAFGALPIIAQESSSGGQDEATPVVVASGLTSPRDMVWGANNTIIVALAGSGGFQEGTEDAAVTDANGSWTGGPTAAVATRTPVLSARTWM